MSRRFLKVQRGWVASGVLVGSIVLIGGGLAAWKATAIKAADAAALLVGYPGRGPGEIFRPTLLDPAGITVDMAFSTRRNLLDDETTARVMTHPALADGWRR